MPTKRSGPLPLPLSRLDPKLRSSLLSWFSRHQRDLPWRHTSDPYAIWVSEVMLQQTQVDRVIGYWSAFLKRFSTVQKLARAPLEEVLKYWQGLGYYSRARNLHKAAKVVVAEHGGTFPSSVEALQALPGFGRYTAGAVASIAFGKAAPLVDGNVARVFSRLFGIDLPVGDKQRDALLWARAEQLVKGAKPGDLNQSLMELGATVCTPQNPMCLICPVQKHCEALKSGRVAQLPPPKKAMARKALHFAVAVCRRQQSLLMMRRPEEGLFSGLWEMPAVQMRDGQADGAALLAVLLAQSTVGRAFTTVERALTHRDLTFHLHDVTLPLSGGRVPAKPYVDVRWCDASERTELGISSAMQAAIAAATGATRVMPRSRRRLG